MKLQDLAPNRGKPCDIKRPLCFAKFTGQFDWPSLEQRLLPLYDEQMGALAKSARLMLGQHSYVLRGAAKTIWKDKLAMN